MPDKERDNASDQGSDLSDDPRAREMQPLLPQRPDFFLQRHISRRCGVITAALAALLLLVMGTLVTRRPSTPSGVTSSVVRLMSLSCWGSPASFGVRHGL